MAKRKKSRAAHLHRASKSPSGMLTIGDLPVGLRGKFFGVPYSVLVQYDLEGKVSAHVINERGDLIVDITGKAKQNEADRLTSYIYNESDSQIVGTKDEGLRGLIYKKARPFVNQLSDEVNKFNSGKAKPTKGSPAKTVNIDPPARSPRKAQSRERLVAEPKFEELELRPIQTKLVDTNPLKSTGLVVQYWNSRGFSDLFRGMRSPKITLPKEAFKETPTQYTVNEFSIKDLEFGNWLTQEDRFLYLLSTISALHDLRLIVGKYNKTYGDSLGMGLLSISFGARGKSAALAHYEPDSNWINLTRHRRFDKQDPMVKEAILDKARKAVEHIKSEEIKEQKIRDIIKNILIEYASGSASLAHEYGHFLDYCSAQHFAHGSGRVKINNSPFGRNTITGRDKNGNTFLLNRYPRSYYRDSPVLAVRLMGKLFDVLLYKSVNSDELNEWGQRLEKIGSQRPYYVRHVEIWARVFEDWIHYELSQKGIVNTALTKHKYEAAVYPPAKILKQAVPVIREIIKALTV